MVATAALVALVAALAVLTGRSTAPDDATAQAELGAESRLRLQRPHDPHLVDGLLPAAAGLPSRGLSAIENISWQMRARATTVRIPSPLALHRGGRAASFAWGSYAYVYDMMVAFGIRPIVNVLFAPDWARADGCVSARRTAASCTGPPRTPEVRAELREFMTKVAQRMPKARPRSSSGTSRTSASGSGATGPDPEHYTHVLCSAYEGVKEATATLPVLTGGIAGVLRTQTIEMSLLHFLNSIYHYGGGDCFDAVGYHSYTDIQDTGHEERGHAARLKVVRDMLTYRGQTNKHIWMTETGYTGMTEALPVHGILDQQGQADALRRTYLFFRDQPKVDGVVVAPAAPGHRALQLRALVQRLEAPEPADRLDAAAETGVLRARRGAARQLRCGDGDAAACAAAGVRGRPRQRPGPHGRPSGRRRLREPQRDVGGLGAGGGDRRLAHADRGAEAASAAAAGRCGRSAP